MHDVSQVPSPPNLVVSARLTRPGASLAAAGGWSNLPMPQSEQVTKLLTNDALGPLVDLDQPIDLALAVAGTGMRLRLLFAASAAVRNVDAAKTAIAQRHKLVPAENGVLLLQGLGQSPKDDDEGDDDGDDGGRACELAPAFGISSMRLVCGSDAKSLSELGPWLTRTAPRSISVDDAHVEVRTQPLKASIAAGRRILPMLMGSVLGVRRATPSWHDAVLNLGMDLADFALDIDTASLDLRLSDLGVTMAATLVMPGTSSSLGRLAKANEDRNAPAPAAFWQMPGDADFALFDRGIDPNDLSRAKALALAIVSDELAGDGVKETDRKPIVDALGTMVSSAPMVYASGANVGALTGAFPAEMAVGWRVLEVDEAAPRFLDAAKAVAAALGRPGVGAAYRAKGKGSRPPSMRATPLPRGSTLPKDAQNYTIEYPVLDGSRKPLVLHLCIVPDGARSWLGFGGDEALVASRLAGAVAGSGDNLNARAELASLKDGSVGAGGFLTARALPESAREWDVLFEGAAGGGSRVQEWATLPHHGVTPVLFSLSSHASGSPPTVAVTVQVPKGAIEDVVAAILRHGGF
jgi:hypothetical protein